MTLRLATGLWVFSNAHDGFCSEGYRDAPRTADVLSTIAKLKGIKAVEIRQNDITNEMPVKEMKRLLKDYGLACSCVAASLSHSRRFALAGFGHQHQKTRNAAIDEGRKAVDIARALGTRPELVFADEPTGNLDSRTGREVLELLSNASSRYGQSIAMVTHDPIAASYADRVVFLADGRVIEDRARMQASEIASFMLSMEEVAR